MRRATTPIHSFGFPNDIKVSKITKALITYSQDGSNVLEKSLDDVIVDTSNNAFRLILTEAETLLFAPGKALVQMRIEYDGGPTLASSMIWLMVRPSLNTEELE